MSQTLHKYDPERLCTYLQHHVAEFSGLAEIVKFSDNAWVCACRKMA